MHCFALLLVGYQQEHGQMLDEARRFEAIVGAFMLCETTKQQTNKRLGPDMPKQDWLNPLPVPLFQAESALRA